MLFTFGKTYRHATEDCVDEFVRRYKCEQQKRQKLREISGLFPTLRAAANDPYVRDHMNIWADDMNKQNSTVPAERGPMDPGIPGYQGFVPRIDSTEAGLGKRYKNAAETGLELFRAECRNHFDRLEDTSATVNKYALKEDRLLIFTFYYYT